MYQLLPTVASLFIAPCPVASVTAQVAVGIVPASRAVEHARAVFHNDSVTAPMAANRHRNRRLLTPTSHPTSIHRSTTQICYPRHLLKCQSPQRPDVTTLQPVLVSWRGRISLQPHSSLTLRGVPVAAKRSARESTPPTRR